MRLLLVRHGLTHETGKVLTGWTPGVHLDVRGLAQADALAARLADVKLDAIYTSPLERCRETAAPVARDHGLKARRDRRFGEVGYGAWTGRTLGTLARTRMWPQVVYRPSMAAFPEGEPLVGAQQRIVRAIEDLRTRHDGNVVVCTHADMIKFAVAHYGGIHLDLYQRIVISPVSVSIIRFGDRFGVQLERLNDTGDLADIAAPATGRGAAKPAKQAAYEEWGHA